MTDPQRLIEADDEFERELIRSAHDDRPNHRALQAMLLGLGVEASKLPSTLSSSAAGSAGTSKLGGAVLAKWLVTGVAIGLASIGGAEAIARLLERRDRPPVELPQQSVGLSPSLAAASDRPVPSAPGEDALATARTPASVPLADARPRVAAGRVLEAVAAPTPVAASVGGSEPSPNDSSPKKPALGAFALQPAGAPSSLLAQEMRLLDAVRRDLSIQDSQSALATLGSYEHTFPSGVLRPEASVLKVRALLAAGDRTSAEALGRRLIEQAPDSPHAAAVRAALGLRSNP